MHNIFGVILKLIQLINVSKQYGDESAALDGVSLEIDQGEFVFLVGPSGAGKSTLLKLLFRQELPSSGQIMIAGRNIVRISRREIPVLRRNMGVVFQDFRLLSDRTVFENVAFALEVQEVDYRDIRQKVPRALELVGLLQKSKSFPHELSGGEQQRVAVARAVVNSPRILIADEPTGNLDPDTSWEIMNLLREINHRGTNVLMATHAWDIVDRLQKRVVALKSGYLVSDQRDGVYHYEN